MKDPLYIAAPFFMVRSPVWSIDDFFKLLKQPDLGAYLSHLFETDSFLREAIFIASPSLHHALSDLQKKSKKEKEQITSSLLKYVLRMTSRSTPFGLFSFVSLGAWNSCGNAMLDLTKIDKRARPDMGWLVQTFDKICDELKQSKLLQVKSNPLVYQFGGRAFLNYMRKKSGNESTKLSIRYNFLTQTILEIAKRTVSIEELGAKVLEKHPTLDLEKIHGVIEKLIEQQLLCLALFPSLLTNSPYNDLLNNLEQSPELTSAFAGLFKASAPIEEYNLMPPGQGEKLLARVQDEMAASNKAPSYVQVDAFYKDTISIPSHVSQELNNAAEVLWKLSYKMRGVSSLSAYHVKFLEKYNSDRLVPILELLNEEMGLGIPDIYSETPRNGAQAIEEDYGWKKWIRSEWISSIHERREEIELTDEILAPLTKHVKKENAALSFELFCEIVSDSAEQVDKGEFNIIFTGKTTQAGSVFGRFIDCLGDNAKNQLQKLLLDEEALDPSCLFAESSYTPVSDRSGNVAIHPPLRRLALDLSHQDALTSHIRLEDIYVGATKNRLFLTLNGSQKELVVTQGDVLNPIMAPIPLRLIRDISFNRREPFHPVIWDELDSFPYYPRVRYKKTILSLARWRVDKAELKAGDKKAIRNLPGNSSNGQKNGRCLGLYF